MRTGDKGKSRRLRRRLRQRGFTYLLLLFLLAIGGAGLAVVGERQQALAQREREAELRFRGDAIARGIQRYAEQSPPGRPVLPTSLEALLEDRRGPGVQRPLRQIYADPFTGKPDWEPLYGSAPVKAADLADGAAVTAVATDGGVPPRGIVGVRSRSTRHLFNLQWPQLAGHPKSARASDLRFIAAGQSAEDEAEPAPPPVTPKLLAGRRPNGS